MTKTRKTSLWILLSLIVIGSNLVPLMMYVAERLNRAKCSDNLRALGQCLLLYTNDTKGQYPDSLGTLALTEDITAGVFVCPSSSTSAPRDLPADQLRDWVNANSDYIYIASNLPYGTDPRIVLAYEKPQNHGGDGINILFQDGHVAFYDREEYPQIVKQLEARINPPKLESDGKSLGFK